VVDDAAQHGFEPEIAVHLGRDGAEPEPFVDGPASVDRLIAAAVLDRHRNPL
jgi:hypothetical protein